MSSNEKLEDSSAGVENNSSWETQKLASPQQELKIAPLEGTQCQELFGPELDLKMTALWRNQMRSSAQNKSETDAFWQKVRQQKKLEHQMNGFSNTCGKALENISLRHNLAPKRSEDANFDGEQEPRRQVLRL